MGRSSGRAPGTGSSVIEEGSGAGVLPAGLAWTLEARMREVRRRKEFMLRFWMWLSLGWVGEGK